MSLFRLYSYYRSSCAYRVRIALYLKKLSFEYQPVNLIKAGEKPSQSAFQKLSPFSQVPALKHGDKVLSQSLPILLYLEELKPKPKLLPKNSFPKAEVLSFCEMINSGIQPLQNLSVLNYAKKEAGLDKIQWARHWIEKGLKNCDSFLRARAKAFCFGESLSLADLFLIPQLYNARRFKAKIPSRLKEIDRRCLQMPAFKKALPENQPDAP